MPFATRLRRLNSSSLPAFLVIAVIVAGLVGGVPDAKAQPALPAIPYVEDFETNGEGTRYVSSFAFNDGVNDHFQRTDGSDIANVTGPYTGFSGSFFWAGEDLDDTEGDGTPFKSLTLQEIDVSSTSTPVFTGLFAAGCSEGPQFSCYDSGDSLAVYYSIDGGQSFTKALQFSYVRRFNDGFVDNFNEPLARDADFDGDGEGTVLGPQMQPFGFALPQGAQTVIIRIDALMNGGAEEFAFDRLTVKEGGVSVVNPIANQTVPRTQQTIVDVSNVFQDDDGRPISITARSETPGIAEVSASDAFKQITLRGITDGRAKITVTGTNDLGEAVNAPFEVVVTPAPPRFVTDVRLAFAEDFCSDVTDPSTCSVVGSFRFSNPRSDTLDFVNPRDPVLVRYVVQNEGPEALASVDLIDQRRGTIATTTTPIPAGDSLVVNKIYTASQRPGLRASTAQATAQTNDGLERTRTDIYAIDVPAPELRGRVRLARAANFCSDVNDVSTCSAVGESRFGAPRSDTLAFGSGEKVLVRYVADNQGTTTIERVRITDTERGVIVNNALANLAPFDSVVVNRIYDTPSTLGLSVSDVEATGTDRGGNTTPRLPQRTASTFRARRHASLCYSPTPSSSAPTRAMSRRVAGSRPSSVVPLVRTRWKTSGPAIA